MTTQSNSHNAFFTKHAAWSAALIGGAMLAGGSLLAMASPGSGGASSNPAQLDLKVEHGAVDRTRMPAGSFAPIVQKVAPSVAEVFVTSKAPNGQLSGPGAADLFQRFFGQNHIGPMDPEQSLSPAQHGLGSGVIVSPDGYLLTNNHVVEHATEVRVALADGREFPATVVGTDPKTDVAVLKIKAEGLPVLTFADSKEVSVGDVVLAVGNPFGIGQTVTEGIVSAKDRVTSGDMDEDFIQTDAAINPGNSGGALVDMEGRLVGINTAILSRSGGNQGIGFAIPSNLCQWVMTSLVKTGRVERGFLGIGIQNITPDLVKAFKLDRINGALVADVRPGSPADNAKLRSGDVIRMFNGEPVKDASQFKLLVAETAPGTKAALQIVRDGESKTLEVTLGSQPGERVAAAGAKAAQHKEALAGVAVADLDQSSRAEGNIPENLRGAVVTEVTPNSPAFEAGLRQGDVITEINHEPVTSAQDAIKDTEQPKAEQTLVKVWSRGGSHYLTVDEGSAG